jgi:hypothetical protein
VFRSEIRDFDTSEVVTHSVGSASGQHTRMFVSLKFGVLLTYLLTPWSRVLLEKLTGLQLVKKFPAFYGTRGFITALTSARHLKFGVY